MVAQPKPVLAAPRSSAHADQHWEPMTDPLHPMHQELLRRLTPDAEIAAELSRPARFAAIFYMAIGAWAFVGLLGYAAYAII